MGGGGGESGRSLSEATQWPSSKQEEAGKACQEREVSQGEAGRAEKVERQLASLPAQSGSLHVRGENAESNVKKNKRNQDLKKSIL